MCCSLSFWELVNLHRFRDSRSLEPPSDDPPLICVAALDATFGTRPFTSRRSRRCLYPAWMRSAIEPPQTPTMIWIVFHVNVFVVPGGRIRGRSGRFA